jgi:hypothetical protein
MPCVHCSISNIACEYPEIKKRGPKKKNVILKAKFQGVPISTVTASLTILSNKINLSVLMREYLNVYEESISQIAGVRLPPFDIKDIINNSLDSTSALVYSLLAHGARALGNNEQGQEFIDKAELASKNYLGTISYETASLYHLIGHYHFGSGNFPSAYLYMHLSKTILDAFAKYKPLEVTEEVDSVYNEVLISLAELNVDPQQKYLAYTELEDRVKSGEMTNSMGIMAALTGKLRSAIQIQSTEVTQEYVENVLDVINSHYDITQLHAAKRQIAPLIMAINALGNLSINRPDKALQFSDECVQYVAYSPSQGRSVTYPLALQIVAEVYLQTNAPQLPANLELLDKMIEFFPVAGMVKQGIEFVKSQHIQAMASSESTSPDAVINSASDELLTPPDIIDDIFGSIVNNESPVEGQPTISEFDQISAEELFDSIATSSPEDFSQLSFM